MTVLVKHSIFRATEELESCGGRQSSWNLGAQWPDTNTVAKTCGTSRARP